MRPAGIFIVTPLARSLFLFTDRHNLPLGPLAPYVVGPDAWKVAAQGYEIVSGLTARF
jgi:hypothetical protein